MKAGRTPQVFTALSLRRQVGRPRWNRHHKRGALPFLAFGQDLAAVQARQLLHQRQADPGPFIATRAGITNPVETLKYPRELISRNSHARVRDAEFDLAALPAQSDCDRSLKREFKR